jgi:hypothetical protein
LRCVKPAAILDCRDLASGDGGNDADFVTVFYRRGFFLLEADVFVVNEDIHEAAHVALIVADAFEEAGVGGIEVVEDITNGGAFGGDYFLLIGELAKRGGDADLDWHVSDNVEVFLMDVFGCRPGRG